MKTAPLRHVVDVNRGVLPETTAPDFEFKYIDISQVDSLGDVAIPEDAITFGAAPSRARRLADPGDTIVSTVRTYLRAIAAVPDTEEQLVFSTGFAVLSPTQIEARFLTYACQSEKFVSEVVASSVGVSYPAIAPTDLLGIHVATPATGEQRRIADFLDDRISRIDRIIAARRQQVTAIGEVRPNLLIEEMKRFGVAVANSVDSGWEDTYLPDGWRTTTLGRVLRQLTNGYVGPTRDILVDAGIRYIQSVHIKNGAIDFHRRPFYVTPEWHAARRRINLRAGDVLIVQTGAIGQVALVPDDFGEASCHALLIARADLKIVSPAYLASFLQSSFGEQAMLARATGALHPHLEGGVRTTPIVVPPPEIQTNLVARIQAEQTRHDHSRQNLVRSIKLLSEYKSSLITAAVTGELDVTTTGSNIPG